MRKIKVHKIAFTGGGTGGHVFPGIAVYQALKDEKNLSFFWIGSRKGIEKSIAAQYALPFFGLLSGKLRRYWSWSNFTDLFRIIGGFFQALGLLWREKPALLFSKGGYVSVPPVWAAGLLGIPVISHESDYDPGLATRLNYSMSKKLILAYEDSMKFYPPVHRGTKVLPLGNPVREQIFSGKKEVGLGFFPQGKEKIKVLVLGGSLGAQDLNTLVEKTLPLLKDQYSIVHQTGKTESRLEAPGYFSQDFFTDQLPHLLKAADLVLSRAGAGSLWELAGLGKKMVLVPLVHGSRGDQLLNAKRLEKYSTVRVLWQGEDSSENLIQALSQLANLPEQPYRDFDPHLALIKIKKTILEVLHAHRRF